MTISNILAKRKIFALITLLFGAAAAYNFSDDSQAAAPTSLNILAGSPTMPPGEWDEGRVNG
jgi:hypothetical protein